jgi:hypothetical protein
LSCHGSDHLRRVRQHPGPRRRAPPKVGRGPCPGHRLTSGPATTGWLRTLVRRIWRRRPNRSAPRVPADRGAGCSSHREPLFAGGRLVHHAQPRDHGARRTLATPLHGLIHRQRGAFEDRLNPAIGPVADPTGHPEPGRQTPARLTKPHALDLSVHPDMAPDDRLGSHSRTLQQPKLLAPCRPLAQWLPAVSAAWTGAADFQAVHGQAASEPSSVGDADAAVALTAGHDAQLPAARAGGMPTHRLPRP